MSQGKTPPPEREVVDRVLDSFLIFPVEQLLDPLRDYRNSERPWNSCTIAAIEGLQSVVNAASLPFQLTQHSVLQRRFDRLHAATRIRGLKGSAPGAGLSPEQEKTARFDADKQMQEFLESREGSDLVRNQIIYELDEHLSLSSLQTASQELLVQALIGTWTVFESFARSFIVLWVNSDPARASHIVNAPELKDLFGKQPINFETMDEHGFDLTNSMGTALFSGRRLDSLKTIKSVFKALFDTAEVQSSIGGDLHLLNQRRNLFVHNRGIIDANYLKQAGLQMCLGERLVLGTSDIEKGLLAVRSSLIKILEMAEQQMAS
ncbi:hypothetical protein [Phaeobacter inhibens]|uniref:hypothetical protein n=1 Tax=Phaeobacter inhibens TaxID=221822 RepID=UPI0024934415|nr:hypothetical protein [Phaeobacter inhibens]